jgi:hypothetical protein
MSLSNEYVIMSYIYVDSFVDEDVPRDVKVLSTEICYRTEKLHYSSVSLKKPFHQRSPL